MGYSNKIEQPTKLWEWVFMYSYPVCFVGSIFYGIVSVVNLDPSSILVNRNVSVIFNVYIFACSIVSMFVWFNIDNPILGKVALNPATIKYVLK